MDVRALVQKAQCMNLDEGQEICSSTRLSDLPDKILWHVLSFLQLKDVVRTSTLSKRWEHLSRNNPRLDISERNFPEQTHFVNFVDKALLLYDFPIKEFDLQCDTVSDRSRIHTWITAAIKRRVENLHVRLYGELLECVLPSCVFNCEEFRLFMSHELKLPLICLTNLKVLTLAWVDFDFGSHSSVEKLLSCPSLEELSLIHCKWRRLKVLHISAPKLLRLHIVELPFYKGLQSTFDLGVHGACIKSFTYIGRFIDCYTISSSSSLDVARIRLDTFGWPHHCHHHCHHHCAYHAYKLLKDLSCVKRLTLFNPAKLLYGRPALLNFLPDFCHLSELEFGTFDDLLLESRFIVVILHKCPHLTHLKFTGGIYVNSKTADAIFDPLPPCFLSSLEVIEIRNFEADYKEALWAVKILLRIAGVLKKLFIHPPWGQQLPGNLLQLLNALPRASDHCEFLLGV